MGYRTSSRSSFSSRPSSRTYGGVKSVSAPKATSYAPKSYPSKPTVVNKYYNSAPAAKDYGYSNNSIGNSIAHGAASGVGAGVGYGVASSLFGSHNSTPSTVVVQQPANVLPHAQLDSVQAQQQAAQAALIAQQQQTIQELQKQSYPQQDDGFGFGSFLVVTLILGGIGFWAYKRFFAK